MMRRIVLVVSCSLIVACGHKTSPLKASTSGGSSGGSSGALTITPSVGTNGALALVPTGPYSSGTRVTLNASPATGYIVGQWSGTDDDSSKSPINHVTVGATPPAVSVTFAVASGGPFHLTLPANLANGTLSADPVEPQGGYAAGTVVALSAAPATGYTLDAWTGSDDATSTALTNQVTMSADQTVGVTFKALPVSSGSSLLTLTSAGNVVASVSSSDPSQAGPGYTPGTVVSLSATLGATGHKVIWTNSDDDSSTATTNTVTIGAAPVTVTATSACDTTCTLTINVVNPPDGYVTVEPIQLLQQLQPTSTSPNATTAWEITNPEPMSSYVALSAHDTTDWPFSGWVSPAVENGQSFCDGRIAMTGADQTVVATFAPGGAAKCLNVDR